MKKKLSNIAIALMLACTYFLMPVQAQETIQVNFEKTEQENQASLSMSGIKDTNAFSLNLKISNGVKLEGMTPSSELVSQGARVNYVYEEEKQTLDIYVTSKKNITYTDVLTLGTLQFSGEDGVQAAISLNEEKDGVKLVSSYTSSIEKPSMEVKAFSLQSAKGDDKDDNNDNKGDDAEEPATTDQILKDEATGVSILAKAGVLPEGTTAKVEIVNDPVKLSEISEKLKEQSTKFVIYDITLWNNGEIVQPKEGSTVSVRFPIPNGYDKERLAVFGVDGDLEIFNLTIDGNEVVFETSHFSKYAIVEKNAETIPVDTTTTEKGETAENAGVPTGDSTNAAGYMVLIAISALTVYTGYRRYSKAK